MIMKRLLLAIACLTLTGCSNSTIPQYNNFIEARAPLIKNMGITNIVKDDIYFVCEKNNSSFYYNDIYCLRGDSPYTALWYCELTANLEFFVREILR